MKKVFATVLVIALMLSACTLGVSGAAESKETEGIFTYQILNGKAGIIACDRLVSGMIEIPGELGGYPVASIEKDAFSGCKELTGVTIPDSVTSIGWEAFYSCEKLESVTISDSVTSIHPYAFSNCISLISINVDPGNTCFHSSGNCLIETESKNLIVGCNNSVIPTDGSVTSIGDSAFSHCIGLTNIIIPDNITVIHDSAFYGCEGLEKISIPDSVLSIGWGAFYWCTGLTDIVIGKGVTSIQSQAFHGCTAVTSITVVSGNACYHSSGNCLIETESKALIVGCKNSVIPTDGSVTSIGYEAFRGCTGLTSITIPDSVTSIGRDAFCGCAGLTSIQVDSENPIYHSAGNCLIKTGSKSLIQGCNNSVIPTDGSVMSIGDDSFHGCTGLTAIDIPDFVTSVGRYAFYGCTGLAAIDIPDSVTSIASRAFYGCTGLTDITIGNSVISIAGDAFENCPGLASIVVDSENLVFRSAGNCLIETISKTLFLGCKNSVIPTDDSVTSIGEGAFRGCTGLTSITIPNSVTFIDWGAFNECTGLSSITIPDSVDCIGNYAFYDCTALTSVTIGNGVTIIRSSAFSGCTGLTSITIPDSVTSIDSSAFSDCTGLTSITIPESVTIIGYDAFNNTAWYNDQPDGLVYAGKVAYRMKGTCPSDVVLQDGTISIASGAFDGCRELKSIDIPDSVTSIGNAAFRDCTGLTTLNLPSGITSIDYQMFEGCTGLTSITIPDGVTYIDMYAFNYCKGLKSITIPKSITSIEEYAFDCCTELTDVYFNGSEKQWEQIDIGKYGNNILADARIHYKDASSVTYTIAYQLDGGKNNAANPKSYTSLGAEIVLQNPTKSGYTFKGWYSDSKLTKKVTKIAAGDTGNKTFYAKWAKTYTITYKLNSGTNNKSNPKTYTKIDSTITLKNPTRKGYTFKGWYSDSKYKKKVTKIAKGSTGNKTLYAKWAKNTYKITYKLNKGKNSAKNPKTYTVTTKTITLKNPTRKGYTFKGWYSDSKYKTKVTKIAKGSTGNKTLYAKWKKK